MVEIEGLQDQRGQICLSLFSSGQGFPNSSDRALEAICIPATAEPLVATFDNLAAGTYAVAVIHDANRDGRLNCNFLGIPQEGLGFSRNPKILFGPPRFRDSAIAVNAPNTKICIQVQYLLSR
jgi:uncharacterized protein (DUF2141 family)